MTVAFRSAKVALLSQSERRLSWPENVYDAERSIEHHAAKAKTISVSAADLTEFCVAALRKCGVNEADARLTVNVLVTTDTYGVFTHGVKFVRGYVAGCGQAD